MNHITSNPVTVNRAMTSEAVNIAHLHGLKNQRLRNVTIHSPSLFWVQSGQKSLFWKDNEVHLDSSNILLTQAQQQLTFENKPTRAKFATYQFSFNLSPPESMLELSEKISKKIREEAYYPSFRPSPSIFETLKMFTQIQWQTLSRDTQQLWVFGLYQQLAEEGKLHHIFTSHQQAFSQRISRFLSHSPDQEHPLNDTAAHFSVSRATFIRRLKKENIQYKSLLAQVRMNHALGLMQQGIRLQTDIALRCGYQSQVRFSQRFRQEFGISPKQYMETLQEFSAL